MFAKIIVLGLCVGMAPVASADFKFLDLLDELGTDSKLSTYSLSIQILLVMTALSFIPAALMITTSFTRIIIVLAILRQALGLNQTPSNQIMIGLSLFLTIFVMTPVYMDVNSKAIEPYVDGGIDFRQALIEGKEPIREFMMNQTRQKDLVMFSELSGNRAAKTADEVTLTALIPAFITSELKTAFQIGFLIFIPFLVIDLVVASVLMAMGMMMLSPMMISLPFKIMLFVLIDGWTLTVGTLASSFYL